MWEWSVTFLCVVTIVDIMMCQVLDEVQAYILLSRYSEAGALVPPSADQAFLQAVSIYICSYKTTNVLCKGWIVVNEEGEI